MRARGAWLWSGFAPVGIRCLHPPVRQPPLFCPACIDGSGSRPCHPSLPRLVDAFLEYDEFFALSRRQYVHPNFAELRHIFNIAQVRARAAAHVWCAAWVAAGKGVAQWVVASW